MTGLLIAVTAVLVIALAAILLCGLAAASHIDAGDIEDDDDEDVTAAISSFDFTFIHPMPPFPIRHIGPRGQHDRFPFTRAARRYWTDQLEASWNLPEQESTR